MVPRSRVEAHRREIVRRQGYVWAALQDEPAGIGVIMRKPRHAGGYEVDAEILAGRDELLVEIKTTAKPSDVYAGVGQLEMYPRLIPRLAGHVRILLLPGKPNEDIAEAIRASGIQLHSFEMTRYGVTT